MIELPFPPSSLSGHNKGHWQTKRPIVEKHRRWAKDATLAAHPLVPHKGDIRIVTTFYPPDNRGDRINFVIRMKPYFDGIADALKVNDKRFLPAFHFGEQVAGGKVVIFIGEGSERFVAALGEGPVDKWDNSKSSLGEHRGEGA